MSNELRYFTTCSHIFVFLKSMLSGGSQPSTVMSCANTFQLLTPYLLSSRSLADRTQTLATPDICRGWACREREESRVWPRSGCDVNQGRSCVASDFMRNASNGQCKTGAVEWQVAVTNRENRIPKNAIIELLFDVQRSSECSKTFFRNIQR